MDKRRIIGIFETETADEAGERVGPILIFDSEQCRERGETEWMTETAARRFAKARGWRFKVDNSVLEEP